MDLNGYKNVANYTASLVDFLGKGKTDYFSAVSQNLLSAYSGQAATQNAVDTTGVNITLSQDTQKLLDAGTKDSSGKETVTGTQKTAQNLMLSFFDQSGVDFKELSAQALDIITGLQDVIGASGATTRDFSTDVAEAKYNPDRKVYTLTGNGTRLRVAVDYTDGAPSKLSITDITGGKVETAEITLAQEDGKTYMNIERTQRAYENGHMTTLEEIEPLSFNIYPST